MPRTLPSLALGVVLVLATGAQAKAQSSNLSAVNDLLGAVSNAYGTLQAAQFVLTFFGIGSDTTTVEAAVDELKSFMQQYRDQNLVNDVQGDLIVFEEASFNPSNTELQSEFLADSVNHLENIEGDIQTGTMDDAYFLAPAYNLLSVLYAGAVRAFAIQNPDKFQFPDGFADSFLTTAFSIDYDLVGAFLVEYTDFVSSPQFMFNTQGGKKMWPKYAGAYTEWSPYTCSDLGGSIYCDNTIPENADGELFLACSCSAAIGTGSEPLASLSDDPSSSLAAAQALIEANRSQFTHDDAVQSVSATMSSILSMHLDPEILDWSNNAPGFGFAGGHVLIAPLPF